MECLHSGHAHDTCFTRSCFWSCRTVSWKRRKDRTIVIQVHNHAMELPVVKRLQIELTFDLITGSHREMKDRSKIYAMHDWRVSRSLMRGCAHSRPGIWLEPDTLRVMQRGWERVAHTRACTPRHLAVSQLATPKPHWNFVRNTI
jgi:hypothetical protein